MKVISAVNVNDAWAQALALPLPAAVPSRGGPVRVSPEPVTTVYMRPWERVLFDPVRDANPFFHLMEALWMLAGRDDAAFLDQFVKDFSARYAEADGRIHGAYGRRWRSWWFPQADPEASEPINQLNEVVRLLRADPADRQAVIAMWDPSADLGMPGLKDRPCNLQICLRVRQHVLDITVFCRSNDIVWGCYGANAVHMSMLQEYLAARIGVGIGTYTQVSNNWHMYEAAAHLADQTSAYTGRAQRYPGTVPLVDDPDNFDQELEEFLAAGPHSIPDKVWRNKFFCDTALQMWITHYYFRQKKYFQAEQWANAIRAPDWRLAAQNWLQRRAAAR